jgi:prephenate dehydrogenase
MTNGIVTDFMPEAADDLPPAEDAICFRRRSVAIVGLGLMGGSLALALKAAGHQGSIIGIARRSQTLKLAMAMGAIDEGDTSLAAVAGAELVVLATPVRTLLRQIAEVTRHMQPAALLLDLGSTKQSVCQALALAPPDLQVLGGHPMCGKETSGLEAADAALYKDKTFVLCPLPRTRASSLATGLALIAAVGARPLMLDPARHDRLAAAISHVPYLASAALVQVVAQVGATDDQVWQVAASGFRDTSRLAGSDPAMMLDILLTNVPAVRAALAALRTQLEQMDAWLAGGDEAALHQALHVVQAQRQAFARQPGRAAQDAPAV